MADVSAMGLGGRMSLKVRPVTVHVIKGPDAGRQARIDQLSFVIGIGETADLRLTDPGVAREHLRIVLGPDGLAIRDEGSKGGILVGGLPVRDVAIAKDAVLTIGASNLAFAFATETQIVSLSTSERFGDVIGGCPAMRALFAVLERAAGTDKPILLEGEPGSGKELLARTVHAKSTRKDAPFAAIDCSAGGLEAELFGTAAGKDGLVDEAAGGTLFLDEIGEVPLELQAKLARLVDQKAFQRVGESTPREANVRIVAATNRRLAEAARTGEFRDDLARKLAAVRAVIPPLRERGGDVLLLAQSFLRIATRNVDAELSPAFAAMLSAYRWPGNVRELRRAVDEHANAPRLEALPAVDLSMMPYYEARKLLLDRFEEEYLPRVLERAEGVAARAAEIAGMSRPSFYRALERIRPNAPPSKR